MASDYLLVLAMVDGESLDSSHPGAIEINTWSLGAVNPPRRESGGLSAGKVKFSDLAVSFLLEKATVDLLSKVSTGRHIPVATLYGRKSGDDKRQDYLVIQLVDVVVAGWKPTGANRAGIPIVTLTLSFSIIKFIYREQLSDQKLGPSLMTTWDLKALRR
jgi:type VI protein secretion system component Hcp